MSCASPHPAAGRGCRDRDFVKQVHAAVHVCPSCGHLYWEGSHVRRIRRRLESFAHEKDKDDTR